MGSFSSSDFVHSCIDPDLFFLYIYLSYFSYPKEDVENIAFGPLTFKSLMTFHKTFRVHLFAANTLPLTHHPQQPSRLKVTTTNLSLSSYQIILVSYHSLLFSFWFLSTDQHNITSLNFCILKTKKEERQTSTEKRD